MRQLFKISIGQIFSKSSKGYNKFIVFFIIASISVCFSGLFIILSLSNGFDNEIKRVLASANGHYRISCPHPSLLNNAKKLISDNPDFLDYSNYKEDYGVLKKGASAEGVKLIGIESDKIASIFNTSFNDKNLDSPIETPDIIVGKKIAQNMDIEIGDSMILLIADRSAFENGRFKAHNVIVSNIFSSGFSYYDESFCFLRQEHSGQIFNDNSSGGLIGTVANPYNMHLNDDFFSFLDINPNYILSWTDWSANSLAWLDAYRMPIVFIALLIIIIALSNMALSLWVLSQDRLKEISVLLTLGFSRRMISGILLVQSFVLTSIGIAISTLLSFVILFIQSEYRVVKIPKDIYHIDYIPVLINYSEIFSYSVVFLSLTILINIAPSYKLYSISHLEHLSDD